MAYRKLKVGDYVKFTDVKYAQRHKRFTLNKIYRITSVEDTGAKIYRQYVELEGMGNYGVYSIRVSFLGSDISQLEKVIYEIS